MPVVTIKIDEAMFKTLKEKFPYHGDISRVIRNAIRAINKGIEFSSDGNLSKLNDDPAICMSASSMNTLIENVQNTETLKKIAILNADQVNEAFYKRGIHSKSAIKTVFELLELANILTYKISEQTDAILIYIEEIVFSPKIIEQYFYEYVRYFCKANRLNLDISTSDDKLPIFFSSLDLFAYLSEYEGFGLPPLEALSCGTVPVLLNRTSLKEIYSNIAFMVDQPEVNVVKNTLKAALTEVREREEILARFKKIKSCFSWRKAAEDMSVLLKKLYG